MGKTSIAAQGCIFSTRIRCREVHPGEMLILCQPCPCSNIWEHLLGIPQGKQSWARGKGRFQHRLHLREGRPLSMGVSVQLEEGSLKGKVEREKKVLGPVSGELVWRQVWELNHAVKELHGSHDVLILSGAGGKQASWAQNSNRGSSPKPGYTLMAALAHGTRSPGITGSSQALLASTALLICMGMLAWVQFPKQSSSLAPGSPGFTSSLQEGSRRDKGPQGRGW